MKDNLNPEQQEAVVSTTSNLLILAGAGTGKTRVLTHRAAWLARSKHAPPHRIMAVTFTNKAAQEMRQRIQTLLSQELRGMWIGTFHGLCHRILRIHCQAAKLVENFQIIDSVDQKRIIERVYGDLTIDSKNYPVTLAQWYINNWKDNCTRPQDVVEDHQNMPWLQIYQTYEELCQRSYLVDFAELLLRAYELLLHNPPILSQYQQRFLHVLVDEFQDTNEVQYLWFKLLAQAGKNIRTTVVGDDDQAIYGWRGGQAENLPRYQREFESVEVVRLEQNYRSSATILEAANALIKNNTGRMGKDLWSKCPGNNKVKIFAAFNEKDEARYVTETINTYLEQEYKGADIAVLYRANALSRALEEAMIEAGIHYRIYGGIRFFERKEIKDAVAYLRLMLNRDDDAAFARIVNFPPRRIGKKSLQNLRDYARDNETSLWQAAQKNVTPPLKGFMSLLDTMAQTLLTLPLDKLVENVLNNSGLLAYYTNEPSEKGALQSENLKELVSAAANFSQTIAQQDLQEEEIDGLSELQTFLSYSTLESDAGGNISPQNQVTLMTLHSAKGLEFPIVFITGMEEELFPHSRSIEEGGIEEERRLCYVGMTRAMEQIYLCYAESRRLYGNIKATIPSRFLHELPTSVIADNDSSLSVTHALAETPMLNDDLQTATPATDIDKNIFFKPGQRVKHKKFGYGTIIGFEGSSPSNANVRVEFDYHGKKWLVAALAQLTPA